MIDPRQIQPASIMPSYTWLADKNIDFLRLRKKISVMSYLGVPYSDIEKAQADVLAQKQALEIAEDLKAQGVQATNLERKEIVALIAYLQALGQKGGSK